MWWELLIFGLKGIIVLVLLGLLILLIGAIVQSLKDGPEEGQLLVTKINDQLDELRDTLEASVLDEKSAKKARKARQKAAADNNDERPRTYVLDFEGDLAATEVKSLRKEISAILAFAETGDEVVIRLESPGGMVHAYGLAASQLDRFGQAGIPLTVCVDKVAASGGYMMACVGQKILCAPFAMIGSIGVMVMVPNIHRLLKKHDVDFLEMTAGEYKRTVTPFSEISEKGRNKLQEELETAHKLFIDYILKHRPHMDMGKLATGEAWHAIEAKELGLVDALMTSDDFLMEQAKTRDLFKLSFQPNLTLKEKMAGTFGLAADHALMRLLGRLWPKPKV